MTLFRSLYGGETKRMIRLDEGAAADRAPRRVAGVGRGMERRQHVPRVLRRRPFAGGETGFFDARLAYCCSACC